MPIPELPSDKTLRFDNDETVSMGDFGDGIRAMRAWIQQSVTYGLEGSAAIVDGLVTPPVIDGSNPQALHPVYRLSGENGEADQVIKFDISNLKPYQPFRIGIAGADQPITFRHEFTDDEGDSTGDLVMIDGQDVTLHSTKHWLEFRLGPDGRIEQTGSSGIVAGGVSNPAIAMVNGGGQPVFNFKAVWAVISKADYVIDSRFDPSDPASCDRCGIELIFTGADAHRVELPGGASYQIGDHFFWSQDGAGAVTFTAGPNASVVNAYGYDTSAGDGAAGMCKVLSTDPVTKWQLVGDVGGTATSASARTFVTEQSNATIETDANSTADKLALTLSHSPGDNEQWLYIARGWFSGGSTNSTNQGRCKLSVNGIERPGVTRPRYQIHKEPVSFIWGESYGTSPGPQMLTLTLNSSTAQYASRLAKPGLIGIKLRGNEGFARQTGGVTNATANFVDVVSWTATALPAGDYVILAGSQWTASDVDRAEITLTVDGANVEGSKREMSRNGPGDGYWCYAFKVTLAAGAHTLAIRHRSTGNSTITSLNACIGLLEAAQFEQVNYVEAQAETGLSNGTGFTSEANDNFALKPGWASLILASGSVYLGSASGADSAHLRLARNGSLLGEEVHAGSRLNSCYGATGNLIPAIVSPQGATDSLSIETKSSSDTLQRKGKGFSITALALAPLS